MKMTNDERLRRRMLNLARFAIQELDLYEDQFLRIAQHSYKQQQGIYREGRPRLKRLDPQDEFSNPER